MGTGQAAHLPDRASSFPISVPCIVGGGRMRPPRTAGRNRVPPGSHGCLSRPAGLTERESQILGLLARGLQTKQIARALHISAKTADGHIQNTYRKIGVS